jgi:hypothetical protein
MKIRVEIHWSDLFDLSDPLTLRAFMRSLPVGSIVAAGVFTWLAPWSVAMAIVVSVMAFAVAEVLSAALLLGVGNAAAGAALSFVAPSGGGTPSIDDYSEEKSLIARGRIDDALAAIEGKLAIHPTDPALLLFAADVQARQARNATAAERLFLRVREVPGATREHDYAATNRLIDLYMGPLDDTARATAELERMRTHHPGTTAAAGAEKALARLRS